MALKMSTNKQTSRNTVELDEFLRKQQTTRRKLVIVAKVTSQGPVYICCCLLLLVIQPKLSLINNQLVPFVRAQCPWTRDSPELHSDCICDFNPSQQPGGNLQEVAPTNRMPINRMSVQCAPVDFEQLLRALKQTASVELPAQLARRVINDEHDNVLWPRNRSAQTNGPPVHDESVKEDEARLISQTKLDLLHVSNSSIGFLDNNTFVVENFPVGGAQSGGRYMVVAIQSLHLSRCGIARIEANAFNGLEWSLTSLSLSDNQLEFVPESSLNKLTNLRVLDLSNNKIVSLGANTFARLTKLNTLRLADNRQIGQQSNGIDARAFDGLEDALIDLNLKNTMLGAFPVAISRLKQLAFLNLAQNQISQIPPKSFGHMNLLTAINLERNRISTIDDDTFDGVENSLSSLSLLGNLIDSFPARQLARLTALRRLDMGFNRIEVLPVDSFAANKRLILIALDGNPLETLPELAFKPLEGTLRGLSIGGKALNCDCRLSWMLRWQLEYSIQISSRERTPQFCSRPHYLRSLVSFAALKPEHLTCSASGPSALAPLNGQQTTYVPVALLTRSSSTIGGWLVTNSSSNGNQDLQPSYFTLTQALGTPQEAPSTSPRAEPRPSVTTEHGIQQTWTTPAPTAAVRVATTGALTTTVPTQSVPTTTREAPTTSELAPTTTEADLGALDEESTARSDQVADDEPAETSATATSSSSSTDDTYESGHNNSLGSLPDDELFVATAEPTKRKISRHGYLAANDSTRRNRTHTAAKPKPTIQSVFGDRAPPVPPGTGRNGSTADARSRSRGLQAALGAAPFGSSRLTGSGAGQQQAAPQQPQAANPSIVPAVPTTISVYKTPISFYFNQTSSPRGGAATQHGGEELLRFESSPLKGARLVDEPQEQVSARAPQREEAPAFARTSGARRPQAVPATSLAPRLAPTTRLTSPSGAGSDFARYSAAAALTTQARGAPAPLTSQSAPANSPAITTTTTTLVPLLRALPVDLGRLDPVTVQPSGRNSYERQPETTITTSRPPHHTNARMSVSSLYRLTSASLPRQTSASSTTTTTSSTTVAPTQPQLPIASSWPEPTARDQNGESWQLPSSTNHPTRRVKHHEQPETTTRMAATVRIVDSVPQTRVVQVMQRQQHQPAEGPSSSTTPRPAPGAADQQQQTSAAPSGVRDRGDNPAASNSNAGSQRTTSFSGDVLPVSPVEVTGLTRPITSSTIVMSNNESAQDDKQSETGPRGAQMAPVEQQASSPTQTTLIAQQASQPSPTTSRPATPADQTAGSHEQHQGASTRVSLVTKETVLQKKSSKIQDSPPPISFPADFSSQTISSLMKLSPRLADFDQLALIVAASLCLGILLLAFIAIVCTCCSIRRSRPDQRQAVSSSATAVHNDMSPCSFLSSNNQLASGQGSGPNCLIRFLCCCLLSSSPSKSASKRAAPVRPLIMTQEDDNSSGRSSNAQLMSGKSMLLTGNDKFYHSSPARVGRKQQAHGRSSTVGNRKSAKKPTEARPGGELGRQNSGAGGGLLGGEYFLGVARTLGRRGNRWMTSSEMAATERTQAHMDLIDVTRQLRAATDNAGSNQPVGNEAGWLSDSCDSDKSCSPGANKNNRYNISDAHRAYLAGQQIQVSMFVTTADEGDQNNQRHRSGLLKTIDQQQMGANSGGSQPLDYFEHMSGASTDDSRAPLDGSSRQVANYLGPTSFVGARSHQLARAADLSSGRRHGQQAAREPGASVKPDYMSCAELVPISAEEEWPEPYVDQMEAVASSQQALNCQDRHFEHYIEQAPTATSRPLHYHHDSTTSLVSAGNGQHQHQRRRPVQPDVCSLANFSAHRFSAPSHQSDKQQLARNGRGYDDAYLANWHTVDRNGAPIGVANNGHHHHRRHHSGGATNWLRWTPTN